MWVVSDESTAVLMQSFHRALAAGSPADVALAKAMNDVRADARWSDPRFWGAFRVVGAGARR